MMGPPGVGRCAGKPGPMKMSACLAPGEVCKKTTDCCAGESCAADASGRLRCRPAGESCVNDAYPCALDEECCGGHCLPDATGVLSCRSICAPIGAPCSATDDCCGGACTGNPGALVCAPIGLTTSAPTCFVAGDGCDPKNPACCGGTVCASLPGATTGCAPAGAVSGS
jgi:hypothetical protein